MRNLEEKQAFADRSAVWNDTHIKPLAAAIAAYAKESGRGQPPAARVYLRDVPDHAEIIAYVSLDAMIQGAMRGDGLTAMAAQTAKAVAKQTGNPPADGKQAVALGFLLLGLVCDVTGAAQIVAKHGDRPNKVEGGVKVTPSYELIVTRQQFLADAVMFSKVGMPTYSKAAPTPWQDQKSGGVQGQDHGLVHSAGKQMAGVTSGTAPDMFNAANAAQQAAFRVNQTISPIVLEYDDAAAFAWLTAHFITQGMELLKAAAKAREAARL